MSTVPLTSRSARVKQARRLTRRASRIEFRQFLAEGPQAVREALSVADCVIELFVSSAAMARYADLVQRAAAGGVEAQLCDEPALASLAGSVSPQGIVAICCFVDVPLTEAVRPGAALIVIGAHLRDPGNAGSLLRCADAAGADAVIFAGSSVDPYNDKAVRASVGSIFHLPIVIGTTVQAAVDALRGSDFVVLAADGGGDRTLDELLDSGGLAGRVAWVFGNEAWGIPADEAELADEVVAVPIYGKAESLNVATAAAVCLYTTARAQRNARQGVDRLPGRTP